MNLKLAAARLVGLSATDIFFLKSVRHPWWLLRYTRLPIQKFEFPPLRAIDEADRALARRIIAFYSSAAGGEGSGQRSEMWDRNLNSSQAPLVDALRRQDEDSLADLLNRMLRSQVVRGIDSGNSYTDGNWRVHSLKLLDNLASLAEQIGVARAESSQGESARALSNGLEPLVAAIERELGMAIGVPEVGGPYGLRVGGQLITLNCPEYARVAWRLREATRDIKPLNVVEIGAGYGAMARYFLQLAPVERYTIVDLPEIACLQAYYLGKCLGADAIRLHGEAGDAKVRIVPPHALSEIESATVVFNQDSLPEIPPEAAKRYIAWMGDHLSGIFYSCNHETLVPGFAVTSVPELIAQVGGLERIRRDMCWSRPGYVEEIYRPV
jgi:hypothetical protein